MKDTVAIIGSHPRTRGDFDFARTDADVWVFNEAISNKSFARADAVFQMHEEAIWRNPNNRNDPGHFNWLQTVHDLPVYMQDVYADVPASRRYPLEDILQMIGNPPEHFLTSSVPQAMALAAHLGYKRVEIYGVAMETNTEYQFQREGVAHWLGYLRGRGIETYFASDTFVAPLYGYEGEVVIDYHRFAERIAELEPQIAELSKHYHAVTGKVVKAIEAFQESAGETNGKALIEAVHVLKDLGDQLGYVDGQRQENQKYKSKADTMKEASGEFLFSRQEFESSAKTLSDKAAEVNVEFIAAGAMLGRLQEEVTKTPKGSKKREKAMLTYRQTLQAYLNANNQVAVYKGAAHENLGYMSFLDKHIRAAGGVKSEEVLLERMRENVGA